MNTQQAKFILQGYRPNGADAGDATFAEALEQAKHDMVLRDWFAKEQAFDAAISAKLGQVQAPAGLRESILAGARLTVADTTQRSWWRHPVWMAAAAGVAALLSVSVALWPKPALAGTPLVNFTLTDATHTELHGGHGAEAGALTTFLSQPTTRLGQAMPVEFASLRTTGCRTLSFEGHDLLEVCFQRNGTWFHCYIMQRADFPSLAMPSAVALFERNGLGAAAWADTSRLYVVVSEKGRTALEKLL